MFPWIVHILRSPIGIFHHKNLVCLGYFRHLLGRGKLNKIAVVGTARFRMGWPSGEIKEIKKDETMFNTCYHTIDKNGILLTRWMDNNLVFMVSSTYLSPYLLYHR